MFGSLELNLHQYDRLLEYTLNMESIINLKIIVNQRVECIWNRELLNLNNTKNVKTGLIHRFHFTSFIVPL